MPNLVANGGKVGAERERRRALAHVLKPGVRREQRGFATYTKSKLRSGTFWAPDRKCFYKTAMVVSVTLGRLDSKRYSMQGWRGQLGRSAFVKPRYPSVLEVEGGASCMLRICHGVP